MICSPAAPHDDEDLQITRANFASSALGNPLAKSPIALQVPFATHRFAPRRVLLSVKQNPSAPARRARAHAGIVSGKATIEIVRPAHIRPIAIFAGATEDVDETLHWTVLAPPGKFFSYGPTGLRLFEVEYLSRSRSVKIPAFARDRGALYE